MANILYIIFTVLVILNTIMIISLHYHVSKIDKSLSEN